jgi:hypothetical protein
MSEHKFINNARPNQNKNSPKPEENGESVSAAIALLFIHHWQGTDLKFSPIL